MRQLTLSAACIFAVFGLGGCQSKAVLPPEVAGTWKARDRLWKITLLPDGTVHSVLIPLGLAEVGPNQALHFEMKDGSISTVKAGNCTADYNPKTRELFVKVDVEHIEIRFEDQLLEGHSENIFFGVVSEDGKLWETEFLEVFDYGPRFPQDANDIIPEPVVFEKVQDTASPSAQNSSASGKH
jgi:hypothetical protein